MTEHNSGCEASGWNVERGRIPDMRYPNGISVGRIPDVRHPDEVERGHARW